MAFKSQNLNQVAAYGDQVAEGCYHFRVDKLQDTEKDVWLMYLKVQTEPFVGRSVRERFDDTNQTSLAKMKSYYKACGYEPGPEGHDPEHILGGEFYAVVTHNTSGGTTYANIAPWSIRSIQEGPVQPLGPKA